MPWGYPSMFFPPLSGVSGIESGLITVGIFSSQLKVIKIFNRGQNNFWGKRQRCDNRPWRQRAVVGTVRYAAGDVIVKTPVNPANPARFRSRAVAGRNSPTVLAIAFKVERISYRILLLHVRGSPAVFKIVDPFVAHELVLDSPKIDPHMRKLVNENRGCD